MEFPIRINKYLAHKGLATRREADTLIEAGKVLVNGKKATIGQKVGKDDTVELVGAPKTYTYALYYKPRGIIAHSPAEDETDIAEKIEEQYGRTDLFPLGRLDKDSEGLIMLTNDGRITGKLLDPEKAHEKEYEVTVDKRITNHLIKHLASGVLIERYKTKPADVEKVSEKVLRITLTEGKKHQIRRMCAALGYQVQKLKRIRVLIFTLEGLKPNQMRLLSPAEVDSLHSELG